MKTLPLIFAVISVLMPVAAQKTGLSEKYGFKMKMLCAFMYLATGVISAALLFRVTPYSLMMLGALVLGVLGDFFLSYRGDRYFPAGMAFFAAGHIAYIITLLCTDRENVTSNAAAVSVVAVILYLLLLLIIRKLKFKKYRELMLIYAAVLVLFFACTLVMGGVCAYGGNLSLCLCIIFGGALFFASDLMLGLGKGGIKRPDFLHNAVSYTYFAAQTLFALSIYFQ